MLPSPALALVAGAHSGGHVLHTDLCDVQYDCAATLDLRVLIFSVEIVAPSATAAFCKTPSNI
jgi:hypothetical protein